MLQLGLHIVICYALLRFEQLLTNLLEKKVKAELHEIVHGLSLDWQRSSKLVLYYCKPKTAQIAD